jgi:hypothetical protein
MGSDRDGNPFIGSRPFERADSGAFFGREAELCELVSLVFANRVVVLHSPPGAGKTSMVNAGLLPRLQTEEDFDVLPVVTLRPPAERNAALGNFKNVFVSSLLCAWAEPDGPGDDAGAPGSAEGTIAGLLRARPLRTFDGITAPRLVVVDQLEHLFTTHPERWRDRAGFFEQLADALVDDDFLRVLLVVRDEHLADLDPYRSVLPGGLRARFRLDRLTLAAAVEAIVGPFEDAGKTVPAELAEGMAHDLLKFPVPTPGGDSVEVEGEFVDPRRLQLVCRTRWPELQVGA